MCGHFVSSDHSMIAPERMILVPTTASSSTCNIMSPAPPNISKNCSCVIGTVKLATRRPLAEQRTRQFVAGHVFTSIASVCAINSAAARSWSRTRDSIFPDSGYNSRAFALTSSRRSLRSFG